jgi:hypothetical protein
MSKDSDPQIEGLKPVLKPAKAKGVTREDRLKAALKANMARRKAQAKARTVGETEQEE